MKKVIIGIILVLIVLFAYEYQKPIMTTVDATIQAIDCVNNPPSQLAIKPINYTLEDLQTVHTFIDAKSGYLNHVTNQREVSVTLVFKDKEPTVKMDAYSGKCIWVSGPLN
ncbi:hypothetical protein [Bacillus sp. OK048]|uniref:hypothetical protein n=1 Tax=Bacillus sp. OK048 TaxID=1882761 RepID=UPI00088C6624|nr:hypothetical protein [Bacillus sp. OK048]SDN90684.1 hypothetical protein SAMN05443253_1263 [Bacillus sp. OK048]